MDFSTLRQRRVKINRNMLYNKMLYNKELEIKGSRMQENLLSFYRQEYENDPSLTIAGLCNKYSLNIEDLGDTREWTKIDYRLDTRPLSKPAVEVTRSAVEVVRSVGEVKEQLLDDQIGEYKKAVMTEVLYRLKTETKSLSTKDLKDLTLIVDLIDKSNQKGGSGQQINVLVQNIVKGFKDDC